MRKTLLYIFLIILGTLLIMAALPLPSRPAQKASNLVLLSKLATHRFVSIQTDQKISCSGTAIGPHALMTARHCDPAAGFVELDGQKVFVDRILHDDHGHSIYIVRTNFVNTARVSTYRAGVGDQVYMYGNPGALQGVLRQGYAALVEPGRTYYDLNGFTGDSGAAMFDHNGIVVDVVEFVWWDSAPLPNPTILKFIGTLPIDFDRQLLDDLAKGN